MKHSREVESSGRESRSKFQWQKKIMVAMTTISIETVAMALFTHYLCIPNYGSQYVLTTL